MTTPQDTSRSAPRKRLFTSFWRGEEREVDDIPLPGFKPCDSRPKRGGWAPGSYCRKCDQCGEGFVGDKRASICADCAYVTETTEFRRIHGAIKSAIDAHGPITKQTAASAAKRIIGAMKTLKTP